MAPMMYSFVVDFLFHGTNDIKTMHMSCWLYKTGLCVVELLLKIKCTEHMLDKLNILVGELDFYLLLVDNLMRCCEILKYFIFM
jgi:hypothetical protein